MVPGDAVSLRGDLIDAVACRKWESRAFLFWLRSLWPAGHRRQSSSKSVTSFVSVTKRPTGTTSDERVALAHNRQDTVHGGGKAMRAGA